MVKYYAVIKMWNENDNIREVLLALKGHFTSIFVLDGANSYFPYGHSDVYNQPFSTDGSIETIENLMPEMPEVKLLYNTHPYTHQIDKMNYGINLCPARDGDYIFFFDAHEVLRGDLSLQMEIIEREQWPIGKIAVVNPALRRLNEFPIPEDKLQNRTQWRILRWHEDLHLKTYHWNFNVLGWGYLNEVIPNDYGVCTTVFMDHMPKNPERDRINALYKKDAGRFHYNEIEYVKWRKEHKIENGRLE